MTTRSWRTAAAVSIAAVGTLAAGLAMPAASADTFGLSQAALAAARQSTAAYPTWDAAEAAGWVDPGLPCFDDPTGGMGNHLLAPWTDLTQTPDPAKPNVLVFDPVTGHRVAVEWVVLQSAVSGAPTLFGHTFEGETLPDGVTQIWELHAYVWDPNPNGLFNDWNPRVNMCP
jgi:hypothetical protein